MYNSHYLTLEMAKILYSLYVYDIVVIKFLKLGYCIEKPSSFKNLKRLIRSEA